MTKKKQNIKCEMQKPRRIDQCPNGIQTIVKKLSENYNYEGHSKKPFQNKENALYGKGPFWEYVAKGNKQRVIFDQGTNTTYATMDHHQKYFEIE